MWNRFPPPHSAGVSQPCPGEYGGSRGGWGIAHFLHHFTLPASLVTAITKGCSALGDMDLSQPTKPESHRLLTSPWGLGVTLHALPEVAWDGPPGDRRLHLFHEVRKHRFLPTENCDYILGLFLAILGP